MAQPRCGNPDMKVPYKVDTVNYDDEMGFSIEAGFTSTSTDSTTTADSIEEAEELYKERLGDGIIEKELNRRKRFVVIAGVPTWISPPWNFTFPITAGFQDYSPKMTNAQQDAALEYCLTVSVFSIPQYTFSMIS